MRPVDQQRKTEGNFHKLTDVMQPQHQLLVYRGQWRQKVRKKDTVYLGAAKAIGPMTPGKRFMVRAVHPDFYHLETDAISDAAGDLYIFDAPEGLREEDKDDS